MAVFKKDKNNKVKNNNKQSVKIMKGANLNYYTKDYVKLA